MSRKIRRAPVWVPRSVRMRGARRALAFPLLLSPIAAAAVLEPTPGPSVRLISTVGHCGSNMNCFFDATRGSASACSGPKFAIPDCPEPDAPAAAEVLSLDLANRVESRRAAGVMESSAMPLSIVQIGRAHV